MNSIIILILACGVSTAGHDIDKRGLISGTINFMGDVMGAFQKQLAAMKDIYDMMMKGEKWSVIASEVFKKHSEVMKHFTLFTAVCQLPTVQNLDYVGKACQFIDGSANTALKMALAFHQANEVLCKNMFLKNEL